MVSRRTERRGSVSRDPRGQVGIGTLIVFIAMVLVATIAGGVLLDTAGLLQSQAEDTGESSTEQVSDRVQVISAVGISKSFELEEDDAPTGNPDNVVIEQGAFSPDPFNVIREGDADEPIEDNVVTADGRNIVVGEDIEGENRKNVETEDGVDVIRSDGFTATSRDIDGDVQVVVDEEDSDGDEDVANNVFEEDQTVKAHTADDFDTTDNRNVETANGVDVIPARFFSESGGEVREVELTVGTGPGSGPVDLDDVTIQYLGPDGVANLVSNDTEDADGPTFEVERIRGENTDNVLVDHGDRSKIVIDLVDSDDALEPLTGGEEVQLTLVTGSGATTTVQFTVPSTIPDDGAIRL